MKINKLLILAILPALYICLGVSGEDLTDFFNAEKLMSSVSGLGESNEVRVLTVYTAIAVKNNRPAGISILFNDKTPRIYVFFDHKNINKLDKIFVTESWFSKQENKFVELSTFNFDAPKNEETFHFALEKPQDGWKLGKYKIDINIKHMVRNSATFEITDKPVNISLDSKIPDTVFDDDGKFINKTTYQNDRLGIKVKLPEGWSAKPDGNTFYIFSKNGDTQVKIDFIKQRFPSGAGSIISDNPGKTDPSNPFASQAIFKSDQNSDENRNNILRKSMSE